MQLNSELKKRLAEIIVENLKKEFEFIHLSGNIANTIKIQQTENGWAVEIPAQIYNIPLYRKTGAILYTNKGSYASSVDIDGGISGRHRGFIDECIKKSINEWLQECGEIGRIF